MITITAIFGKIQGSEKTFRHKIYALDSVVTFVEMETVSSLSTNWASRSRSNFLARNWMALIAKKVNFSKVKVWLMEIWCYSHLQKEL